MEATDPPWKHARSWTQALSSGAHSLRQMELETRHNLLHQLHAACVMIIWLLSYVLTSGLQTMSSFYSSDFLTSGLQKMSSFYSSGDVLSDDHLHAEVQVADFSNTPIARALTQVLALVNDVPVSSNKYVFLQELADRVIEENRVEGVKCNAVNQAALRRGFSRTIHRLGQALGIRQQRDSFLGRVVNVSSGLLPSVVLPGPFVRIRSFIGNILPSLSLAWIPRPNLYGGAHPTNFTDTDIAEKYAMELLWMARKMENCGVMEEAVAQWSSVPALAQLSLGASPKVQKSLARLSALLCNTLVGHTNIPQEVRLQVMLLWLPLLCNATHGGDGPIFSTEEKRETEKTLEQLVAALPVSEQEQVLSTWLQEHALSQSDFPNLRKFYDNWYWSMRKLEVDIPKIMNE